MDSFNRVNSNAERTEKNLCDNFLIKTFSVPIHLLMYLENENMCLLNVRLFDESVLYEFSAYLMKRR